MTQPKQQQLAAAPAQPVNMLEIISKAASDPNVDIDKMDRLLQMKERFDAEEARKQYAAAMVTAQAKMPSIVANKLNEQTRSKFAKLEKIIEAIRPVYTDAGFSLSFGEEVCPREGWFRTICHVNHAGGHSEVFYYDLPLDIEGAKGNRNKTDIHGKASMTTYAQRYLTKMIFNLAVGEDVDGNQPKEPVSEEQAAEIKDLIADNDIDLGVFLAYLSRVGKVSIETVEQIPAIMYRDAIAAVNASKKKKEAK